MHLPHSLLLIHNRLGPWCIWDVSKIGISTPHQFPRAKVELHEAILFVDVTVFFAPISPDLVYKAMRKAEETQPWENGFGPTDLSGSHQRQHQIMANDAIFVHACPPCPQAERACSISMDLVDAEDSSSPPSFRIGLSWARRKNQIFGSYEEAVSVSIRDLRQAPTSQQYPAPSLPPLSPPSLITTS
nr:unnamed protein product [Spirometra erinaceieuropaei]